MRTAIELGPRSKKVVAYAIDWPGLERNGKTKCEAMLHMDSYRARYQSVADRAGLGRNFAAEPDVDVAVTYEGTGSTDFWGISFAHSPIDREPISVETLGRQLSLLAACWTEFDHTVLRVSPELKKGPRGGGRDRDHIVRHVLATEIDWVKKLNIRLDLDDVIGPGNRQQFRETIIEEILARHSKGKPAQAKGGPPWELRFLIRHLAYHAMDHAWEMQDRDLSYVKGMG